MNLEDHAKKFGVLYLAGAILIGCAMVSVALLPKSRGQETSLRESDMCVASRIGTATGRNDESADSPESESQFEVSVSVHPQSCDIAKKVQLWKDGPYWADRNIGADKPWESGYYFWWGDTVGYRRKNDTWAACDGSSSNFSFEEKNTPTCGKNLSALLGEGWITADNVLAAGHDAAQVHWGGKWRLPTDRELNDLLNKCEWAWMTINGENGYVVRGMGDYASCRIFLPAAGIGDGILLASAGMYGGYGASTPDLNDGNISWILRLKSSFRGTHAYTYPRYLGRTVRPVQGGAK